MFQLYANEKQCYLAAGRKQAKQQKRQQHAIAFGCTMQVQLTLTSGFEVKFTTSFDKACEGLVNPVYFRRASIFSAGSTNGSI